MNRQDCPDGGGCGRQKDLAHAREFNHLFSVRVPTTDQGLDDHPNPGVVPRVQVVDMRETGGAPPMQGDDANAVVPGAPQNEPLIESREDSNLAPFPNVARIFARSLSLPIEQHHSNTDLLNMLNGLI